MNNWIVFKQYSRGEMRKVLEDTTPEDYKDKLAIYSIKDQLSKKRMNTGKIWIIKTYRDARKQKRLKMFIYTDGISNMRDALITSPERLFEMLNTIGCFKTEIFIPKGSKYEKIKIK